MIVGTHFLFVVMSESAVRKVQPFTIGTRLSVPPGTKCQEFPQAFLPAETLDNCVLQCNLNSLYLRRSQEVRGAHGPRLGPPGVEQAAPTRLEHAAAEDHLNQNAASASAVSRSIRKITISGSKDGSDEKTAETLSITGSPCENKNNNNNNIPTAVSDPRLPRIIGVSCENKPNSEFKVQTHNNDHFIVHNKCYFFKIE